MSNQDRVIITTDVTDWSQEYDLEEADIGTLDKAINYQMTKGIGPMAMGRLLTMSRERGDNEEEVLKHSTKLHINVGAGVDWSSQIKRKRHTTKLDNGNTVVVRDYVGAVRDSDDLIIDEDQPEEERPNILDEVRLVKSNEEIAIQRAIKYVDEIVPRHIRMRFNLLAENKKPEEIKDCAKRLKKEIDMMVKALT